MIIYNQNLPWQGWLDPALGKRLSKIRATVKEIYINDRRAGYLPLPYFTPHGPEHCQAVEDLIHYLIPDNRHQELTEKEKFYLLSAAWLHDLGMLRSVVEQVVPNGHNPSAREIREMHHLISERFIVSHWNSIGIDQQDRDPIGKICRYHSRMEDLNKCAEGQLVGNIEWCRGKLLAAYLRLADALDMGSSRAFDEPYATCLAYGIPMESKLHWIKNRLVSGVSTNPDERTITIQFRYPTEFRNVIDPTLARQKLDSIIRLVVDDLHDELLSVSNILTRAGISYYLDVKATRVDACPDERMLNDIRDLVIYDDIIIAPSASKLLEIILVTLAGIIGFSLSTDRDGIPHQFTEIIDDDFTETKNKVTDFLKLIEEKINTERPGHLGLKNLIKECQQYNNELVSIDSLNEFAASINRRYWEHKEARNKIRKRAKDFFLDKKRSHLMSQESINVLLYGFSELVTKAICGLRDGLINRMYNVDPIQHRGSDDRIEKNASMRINIFICECQPKTHTGRGDRLEYHDGSQYALHLKRRGFTNIGIIPDIIAGTMIDHNSIDLILVGADGLTREHFMHSAGHSAIVDLARNHRSSNIVLNENQTNKGLIMLVTSKEKAVNSSNEIFPCYSNDKSESYKIEDCLFNMIPTYPFNRTNIWMCRDTQLLELLYKEKICFVNPIVDCIPISKVDYILSDVGYRKVTLQNANSVISELFFP